MKRKNRRVWILAIALSTLVVLSLALAPHNSRLNQGSTFSRSPDGYGAWYAYLEERNVPVRRWQRPPEELGLATDHSDAESPAASAEPLTRPITLVRIFPGLAPPDAFDTTWAEAGHTLVLVGVQSPVTEAPFSSLLISAQGGVRVETRRRQGVDPTTSPKSLLGDPAGSVVWEQGVGKGKVIYVSTPHLAANAYQNEAGNLPFLAALVTESGHPIWVDEYLHGYRDPDLLEQEARGDVISYLRRTPVMLLAIQGLGLVLLAIWGGRRLGPAMRLEPPKTDSNATYIGALGSVLTKAGSSEFILQTVGTSEREQIQRSLGLGSYPVDPQILLTAWKQQTGQSDAELRAVLGVIHQKRRIRERDLLIWLGNLHQVRRHLR